MSETKTDIRTTSYDAAYARPHGYQGRIDDVIDQMQAEHEIGAPALHGRDELLHYLNISAQKSNGPCVDPDLDARYGDISREDGIDE